MSVKKRDLGLTAYDELFSDDKTRAEFKLPRIHELPLEEIDDFPGHPFQVRVDEDMQQLVQSIAERGIITPVTVRQKEDGRYELVSGHRRKKACELAGLSTVKAEIRDLSRDEAIILMVESNLQRSTILPSEKAFSYKMRLEAMNRQAGRPKQNNLTPVVSDFKAQRTNEKLADAVGESREQIRRYIRLTNLDPQILNMVDENKIAFRPAVELSYLTEKEQESLHETILSEDCTPSLAQAIKMKQFSQDNRLNADVILSILSEEKPNQKEKTIFRTEDLRRIIPESVPQSQITTFVMTAVEQYVKTLMRKKDRER